MKGAFYSEGFPLFLACMHHYETQIRVAKSQNIKRSNLAVAATWEKVQIFIECLQKKCVKKNL
jgi:hypothetical protein